MSTGANGPAHTMQVSDLVSNAKTESWAMQETIARANEERRLIGGFQHVVDRIDSEDVDKILFCILPENLWRDGTQRANFNLLVSKCLDNGVKVIKVDDDSLVGKIIQRTGTDTQMEELATQCLVVMQRGNNQANLECERHMIEFIDTFDAKDFRNLALVKLIDS